MAAIITQHGLLPTSLAIHASRPTRITKPINSRNPSPRNRLGRRMTTHESARTRSVIDPSRNSASSRHSNGPRSRPTSWHAALNSDAQQYQSFSAYPEAQQYSVHANTATTYNQAASNPFSLLDGQYPGFSYLPLNQSYGMDLSAYKDVSRFTNTYSDASNNIPQQFDFSTMDTFASSSIEPTTAAWSDVPTNFVCNPYIAPASPQCPLGSGFENTIDDVFAVEVPEKDELVGMGLYDSPADVQSASLLFGGTLSERRKSLKLEESFEPDLLSDEDAESESVQCDDSSVVSAECLADIKATNFEVQSSAQAHCMDHNFDFSGLQSSAISNTGFQTYPDMSLSMNHQQMPGWF